MTYIKTKPRLWNAAAARSWLALLVAALLWPSHSRADIWIKHQYDQTSWPAGFGIPQPPNPPNDLKSVDGTFWNGSDTAFDGCMRTNAGPWVKVYVGPGTFKTRGIYTGGYAQTTPPGWRMQDHSEVRGSGMSGGNATILLLVAFNIDYGAIVIGSNRSGQTSNLLVKDLQIDCNAEALIAGDFSKPWQFQGIELWGSSSMHVENVLVRRAAGYNPVECFILCLNASSGNPSTGNWIKNCTVQEFYDPIGHNVGKCSAISLNRWDALPGAISGVVQDCSVCLNGFSYKNTGEFAFNCSNGRECTFTNNYSYGANRGFNNDSTPETVLTFVDNDFHVAPDTWDQYPGNFGMYLINGMQWSRIHDNKFYIYGPLVDGIMVSGPSPLGVGSTKLLIEHNNFYKLGTWSGISHGIDLDDSSDVTQHYTQASQIDVEANWVDPGLQNRVPSSVGYTRGNSGNSFPDGAMPNKGWQYTPARADFDLSGTIDFALQDSSSNVKIWQMNGINFAGEQNTTPSNASGWQVVAAADIDRDGQTDFFFQYPSGLNEGVMGYWLMSGATMAVGGTITNSLGQACYAPGWRVVGASDFDGDNKPDLLFQQISTGDLALWFMNGPLLVSTTYLSSRNPGVGWQAVATGDFDRDGWADILFQFYLPGNELDSAMAVWFMRASQFQRAAYVSPYYPMGSQNTDPAWRVAALANFSSDWWEDNLDIVCQHKTGTWGGALKMIRLNGTNGIGQNWRIDLSQNPGSYNLVSPR